MYRDNQGLVLRNWAFAALSFVVLVTAVFSLLQSPAAGTPPPAAGALENRRQLERELLESLS